MSLDFTVAIPTYNGATRLPKLLEKLLQQSNIKHLNWEIIIVDNNSKDATAKIVESEINNWQYSYPLKYYFEAEQGAAFARQRAVREARGELIFFLDDDNLPDTNWLAAAYIFGKEHPKAGAYSGQIHGAFEGEPPENFDKIKQFLAIREHGDKPHLFDADSLRLPPAAALVVRKQAWLESVPSRPFLTGKLPGVMVQGDDYEPLLYIHKAGWEIWYNPAMHTYHQIPQWRLERGYLLTLARGCGLATCSLRMVDVKNSQKPIIILRTILGNLRRVAFHFIKYRQQLKTDLIAAFEMEFFLGSLFSPFLFLKTSLNRRK
ncbi:glycosyltransferase family 2 protein [Microcoleus sp. FACHB-831]|uniref:hormogonium polysaccharide biosynthesis glycosyltransferase HpsE n=1 Tax=Microcoleus sp. FACHB-831 TaxID=2692827 RepID=UPI00168534E6|nr:hormogonium polysaccharide biosynthesis glycosyltransferase HpsE [Microcoleus sp. FACHB-831]MBD1924422.1 glycosyltransferase family 2 protein [Microcoleus sp. FACHB-831]